MRVKPEIFASVCPMGDRLRLYARFSVGDGCYAVTRTPNKTFVEKHLALNTKMLADWLTNWGQSCSILINVPISCTTGTHRVECIESSFAGNMRSLSAM